MLHYGDVEEDTENPAIETLQEKSESKQNHLHLVEETKLKLDHEYELGALTYFNDINLTMSVYDSSSVPVADIKGLLTGKDCPHMKENKGKQNKVNDTLRVSRFHLCSPLVGWDLTVFILLSGGAGPSI